MLEKLNRRKHLGNYRSLRTVSNLIDFASNDYLGLARSEKLQSATAKEWDKFKLMGSTGSRLLTGNSSYAEELEHKIARFHGFESGLLFSCGYMANVGLLSCIADETDAIFYDTHVHASAHDGMRLSSAKPFPFRHNDLDHLEKRLKNTLVSGKKYVCVESVYSMDGTIAPLEEVCYMCSKYQAHLIVDEAHAVGTYGPGGRGLTAEKKVIGSLFAQVTTFGKALGTYGAIVLGSSLLKEFLLNFARSCIYTTALPMHTLAAINCAYDLLPDCDKERLHLQRLIHLFGKNPSSPVQAMKVPGNREVQRASFELNKAGFDVRAIMSPTVQRGSEALRVCLHAFNTEKEVAALLDLLKKYG